MLNFRSVSSTGLIWFFCCEWLLENTCRIVFLCCAIYIFKVTPSTTMNLLLEFDAINFNELMLNMWRTLNKSKIFMFPCFFINRQIHTAVITKIISFLQTKSFIEIFYEYRRIKLANINLFLQNRFCLFSYLMLWNALSVCTEVFWISNDFLHEVRRWEKHLTY